MALKLSPEDLIRENMGPLGDDGKPKTGVWILMEFTSPVSGKTYPRHSFHERPDPVVQWLANSKSVYVLDLRSAHAKRESRKNHHDLLLRAELDRRERCQPTQQ